MPLNFPISEKIDQAMLQAVQQVTVSNGYQVTLSEVVRWDPDNPPLPADLLAIVSFEENEPAKDNDTPADDTPIGHQQWYRHYSVSVYLLKLPTDSVHLAAWRNLIVAEIEKAVMVDRYRGTSTYTVDGQSFSRENAVDTYCRGWFAFQDVNDAGGITVNFLVKYRTHENNPYLPD